MSDKDRTMANTATGLSILMSLRGDDMAPRALLDHDGENLALRSFLMQYSCDRAVSVRDMARHMQRSGWDGLWPQWVNVSDVRHLTKLCAQRWIRHLIDLEKMPVKIRPEASAALLDKIIEKLASDVGPSRELDLMIDLWRTCGCAHPGSVRRYTTLSDHAMSLVPRVPGYELDIYRTNADGSSTRCGTASYTQNTFAVQPSEWPTAREICLAALIAHRALKTEGLLPA